MSRNVKMGPALRCWTAAWSRAAGIASMIAAVTVGPLLLIPADAAEPAATKPSKASRPEAGSAEPAARPQPLASADRTRPLVQHYCEAIATPAIDARVAQLTAELTALARDVDQRIAVLDQRNAELKEWMARREAFINQATSQLVSIYAGMRAEAASEQLARLDPTTAASILRKLEPRNASAILNDMPAEKAARLTTVLMASQRTDEGRKP
jgi:flagellar motility protein MotE (MotC chaperone)